ncbi:hypothetical protein ACXR0O_25095 [Verrucomicrobiota bacterium sgz303538]
MRSLAAQIASGDKAALNRLETIASELYRDIDYQKDSKRVQSNLMLMLAAFNRLGEDAGKGNEYAFDALKYALGAKNLRSHAPSALGIAAAAGHPQAMEMLLDHDRYGILHSSAVFALGKPASKNYDQAVAFLSEVLANPKDRALWHGAAEGLVGAANVGNARAKAALDSYAVQKSR